MFFTGGRMEYPKGLGTILPDDVEQAPVVAYFTPPKKKNYPEKWLVLWQSESEIGVSMSEQAKLGLLTQTDYRVRDYLMGTIGLGNFVFVNQAEIARELRVRHASVCDSVKRLCEMQILVRGPKSGRSNTFMVNPAFCFSGNLGRGVQERKEAIKRGKVIPFSSHAEQGMLI
jgi:hypothetical protein